MDPMVTRHGRAMPKNHDEQALFVEIGAGPPQIV
jgi:hypothetical protein